MNTKLNMWTKRPYYREYSATHQLSCYVDGDTKERLVAIAHEHNVPLSAVGRQAMEEYVEYYEANKKNR